MKVSNFAVRTKNPIEHYSDKYIMTATQSVKRRLIKVSEMTMRMDLPVNIDVATRKNTYPIPSHSFSTSVFTMDMSATGIAEMTDRTERGSDVRYNVQGRRVENPRNGMFIHQGNKIVLR